MSTDDETSIPEYEVPEWKDYECTANGSCCHGWMVEVDEEDRRTIEEALQDNPHPEWGDTVPLRSQEDRLILVMDNNQCPYLTEDGLCWLHKNFEPETKPDFCQTFPRHEIRTPLGTFKSLRFSCVTATRMLTDETYELDREYDSSPSHQSDVEPFLFNRNQEISPETYVALEETALGILSREEGTLPQRLVVLNQFVRTVDKRLVPSGFERLDRLSSRYLDAPLPEPESLPDGHATIMESYISFRKTFLGSERQRDTHHEVEQILGTFEDLLSGDEAGNRLRNLKEQWWEPEIRDHEHVLERYLKRQLWSKIFTHGFSFLGGVKILTYLFALVRLYALSLADQNKTSIERWQILNSIVLVERVFTHSQGMHILWDLILDNPDLAKQRVMPVVCQL